MSGLELFGYIDPGTGSIIVQSVIGVIAGVGIFGRRVFAGFTHKLKSGLSRARSDKS